MLALSWRVRSGSRGRVGEWRRGEAKDLEVVYANEKFETITALYLKKNTATSTPREIQNHQK